MQPPISNCQANALACLLGWWRPRQPEGMDLHPAAHCATVSTNQWEAPDGVRPPPILLISRITSSNSGNDRSPAQSLGLPVHLPPLTPPNSQLVAVRPRGARRAALPCPPFTHQPNRAS